MQAFLSGNDAVPEAMLVTGAAWSFECLRAQQSSGERCAPGRN